MKQARESQPQAVEAATTVDRNQAEVWAEWFAALGDPTRIQILHLLSVENRELTVGEITDRLDVAQSTISHHLSKLADVGFVIVQRVGTSSLWRVNQRCLKYFPSAAEMVMGNVDGEFLEAQRCAQPTDKPNRK